MKHAGDKPQTRKARWMAGLLALAVFQAGSAVDDGQASKPTNEREARAAMIELKNALQSNPEDRQARLQLAEIYLHMYRGELAEKELERARSLGAPRQEWVPGLATALYLQGDARRLLANIFTESSDSMQLKAEIHARRAQALLAQERINEAQAEIDDAERYDASSELVELVKAQRDFAMERFSSVETRLETLLGKARPSNEARVLAARLARERGQIQEMLDIYEQVLRDNPHHVLARMARISGLLQAGRNRDAQNEIQNLEKRRPGLPFNGYYSAMAHYQMQKFGRARDRLLEVLSRTPDHAPSQLLLGAVYFRIGEPEAAIAQLSRFASRQGHHPMGAKILAASYIQQEEYKRALEVLSGFGLESSANAEVLAMAGTAHLRLGEHALAKEYLLRAVEAAPDRPSFRKQLAVSEMMSGDLQSAIAHLEAASTISPGENKTETLLVLAYLRDHRYDDALQEAQKLSESSPEDPAVYNLISAAYIGKKDAARARQALNQALEVDDEFHVARINLARLALARNDLGEAEEQFKQVLERDPTYLAALLGMAQIRAKEGNKTKENEWLERARSASDDALNPRLLLVRSYLMDGNARHAVEIAREALAAHSDDPASLETLGIAQLEAGDTAGAITTFRKLVDRTPDSLRAYRLLGGALIKAKLFVQAERHLKRALQLSSEDKLLLVMLGSAYLQQDKLNEADTLARRLQQTHPDSPAGFHLAGNVARSSGDHRLASEKYSQAYSRDQSSRRALLAAQAYRRSSGAAEAIDFLETHLSANESDELARLMLASLYHESGKMNSSIREYQILIESEPVPVQALNNLAWLYLQAGDRRALNLAERAYKAGPNQPNILDTYGWVLVEMGRAGEAISLLERAVEAVPENRNFRYHLAAALSETGRRSEARELLRDVLQAPGPFDYGPEAKELLQRL